MLGTTGFIYGKGRICLLVSLFFLLGGVTRKGGLVIVRAGETVTLGLITGFMEAGESPEAGICREVMEETGLQVKALRLLCCSEFLRMNQVLIAYHVRVHGKPEDVRLSPELLEYRWQTAEESLCWPAGTGYALAEWIKQKGFEPRFGAFRPSHNPEPDPAKWPVRLWDEDQRFTVAPVID